MKTKPKYASKEAAASAFQAFRRLSMYLDGADQRDINEVTEFLLKVEKRLPRELSFERDRKRRVKAKS